MPRFNPDFWEVTISEESWERFSSEDHLYYEPPGEAERRHRSQERAQALSARLWQVIDEALTPRQREVLLLCFVEELNQRQIAERLGITQQSVCEHLYGKVRNGRAVGGAIRKLRKECIRRGIQWE